MVQIMMTSEILFMRLAPFDRLTFIILMVEPLARWLSGLVDLVSPAEWSLGSECVAHLLEIFSREKAIITTRLQYYKSRSECCTY